MSTVIKVENISKQYRLGDVGSGSIADDLSKWWALVRGKEDPTLQLGEVNDRSKVGNSDYVWALKDINFEVKAGEVLGIIGRNGAGKSTLLKILSKTTQPTTGSVKLKGRVASLLEVGTGFHPELSGRDNIFLNGAILGMTKREIQSKFDEIVDFSGVERYIDTPVKRYSSGMYVRLAFAVAAHLEPEILIVDEVLAVGDAEFQKKCLGKMKDVSVNEGRTVLFVSHNMPSIRALCSSCLLMENGMVTKKGQTDFVITEYFNSNARSTNEISNIIPNDLSLHNTGEAKFKKACIINEVGNTTSKIGFMEPLLVNVELEVLKKIIDVSISLFIVNQFAETVIMATENKFYKPSSFNKGIYNIAVNFTEKLMPGNYSIGLAISFFHTGSSIDYIESFFQFTVSKESIKNNLEYPWQTVHGYILPETNWEVKKL